jgi:uncharacterized membrane protein YphA (DoxX/SURF4 family)
METRWPATARVGFRFLFCYLLLFAFPFPQGLVNPYWLGSFLAPLWARAVPWFSHLLGIPAIERNNGSGDTLFDYVRVLLMIAISAAATVIWSLLDRGRSNYRALYAASRVWIRYALALCMLTYGVVKVVMVQFEPPGTGRLMQPLGELSPMALLWVFMGFSPRYTSFTGLTEVASGILLLFRRTTTLGALVVVAIMTNVLMLNLSYDVPVKLGAIHLIVLALYLVAGDLARLLRFFVLNGPVAPADLGPEARGSWFAGSRWAKALLIGAGLTYLAWDTHTAYVRQAAMREAPPVAPDGAYQVISIRKDGRTLPPIDPGEFRWKRVTLRAGAIGVRGIDESRHRYKAAGDPFKAAVTLFPADSTGQPISGEASVGTLRLLPTNDAAVLDLTGDFEGHRVDAVLKRQNAGDFPLMSREFRWVIEEPYFR